MSTASYMPLLINRPTAQNPPRTALSRLKIARSRRSTLSIFHLSVTTIISQAVEKKKKKKRKHVYVTHKQINGG